MEVVEDREDEATDAEIAAAIMRKDASGQTLEERCKVLKRPPKLKIVGNVPMLSGAVQRKVFGKKASKKRLAPSPFQGVTAFCGAPGSGKTLFLTEAAMRMKMQGARVLTNMMELPFEDDHFATFDELTRLVIETAEIPFDERPWTVVCVDEAPSWANARKWEDFSDGFFYILQQIRKFKIIMYFSCIKWMQVDANLRRQCYMVWECYRVRNRFVRELWPPEDERTEFDRPSKRIRKRPRDGELDAYDTGQIIHAPILDILKGTRRDRVAQATGKVTKVARRPVTMDDLKRRDAGDDDERDGA